MTTKNKVVCVKLVGILFASSLVLFAQTTAAAQNCKPNFSGKDKITKASFDEWTQSLYQTGFLAAATVTTSEVNITGSISRVGDDNNVSVVLTKSESNANRAALESAFRAEKGNEFLFGFKEGGEPWRFVADSVSNNTAADMFGKLNTKVVLTAKLKDEELKVLKASLANRQIDAVRIALANSLTIEKSVKDGDGKRFVQKIGCFFAFAEQKGFMR